MNKDYLIAEISDDNIRYLVYKFDEKSQYKILSKKIYKNNGIKRGKIVDFETSAKKINEDIKLLEKRSESNI